ncbi:MAG: hypothetical protein M1820_006084 [Bogoriella megaspora]|nr:MAG: hypothetical protein M1820_006084 [Bogoriella megaspora]
MSSENVLPQRSALSKATDGPAPELMTQEPYLYHLAQRIAHNLQYQHQWTALTIHAHSPLEPQRLLPRPLISGLPPHRLYVHPDEQTELLKDEAKAKKKANTQPKNNFAPEMEWVLPTHLKEKWSLRKFGEVFDEIEIEPPRSASIEEGRDEASDTVKNKWRTIKRVLLATVDDDSTIVYYIVHDGIVKPRQN